MFFMLATISLSAMEIIQQKKNGSFVIPIKEEHEIDERISYIKLLPNDLVFEVMTRYFDPSHPATTALLDATHSITDDHAQKVITRCMRENYMQPLTVLKDVRNKKIVKKLHEADRQLYLEFYKAVDALKKNDTKNLQDYLDKQIGPLSTLSLAQILERSKQNKYAMPKEIQYYSRLIKSIKSASEPERNCGEYAGPITCSVCCATSFTGFIIATSITKDLLFLYGILAAAGGGLLSCGAAMLASRIYSDYRARKELDGSFDTREIIQDYQQRIGVLQGYLIESRENAEEKASASSASVPSTSTTRTSTDDRAPSLFLANPGLGIAGASIY